MRAEAGKSASFAARVALRASFMPTIYGVLLDDPNVTNRDVQRTGHGGGEGY